jgi:metal-dependent hydrolase (beta-lactamase superfamily II)
LHVLCISCQDVFCIAPQVSGLAAVWVSHKHADHCLGLLGILQARAPYDQPLLVRTTAFTAALPSPLPT